MREGGRGRTTRPRQGWVVSDGGEREAFLEQNREAYDALLSSLKSLETEMAAQTGKPA